MAGMESGVASDERILKARGSTPAARFGPGFAKTLSLEKTEGAGNAGCTPHPLPCVHNKRDARRPTQVRRNHSGTPCAMALRLLRALLGVPGLLASVANVDVSTV